MKHALSIFLLTVSLIIATTTLAQDIGQTKRARQVCPKVSIVGGAPGDPAIKAPNSPLTQAPPYSFDAVYSEEINQMLAKALDPAAHKAIQQGNTTGIFDIIVGKEFSSFDFKFTPPIKEADELLSKIVMRQVCEGSWWDYWRGPYDQGRSGSSLASYPLPYLTSSAFKCGDIEVKVISSCSGIAVTQSCDSSYVTLNDGQVEKEFFIFDDYAIGDFHCYVDEGNQNAFITLTSGRFFTFDEEDGEGDIFAFNHPRMHYFHNTDYLFTIDDHYGRRAMQNPITEESLPGLKRESPSQDIFLNGFLVTNNLERSLDGERCSPLDLDSNYTPYFFLLALPHRAEIN